ncbi:MAG TPA: rRNA maturation RNase YbeY [Ignavibacteriaceae bacterium]|nr:rRNA maturation RNase YbeY [Ignavibacteriaceae bacterium]
MIKNLHISSVDTQISKSALHELIKALSEELNFRIESLEINFTNSEKIREINREYLNHYYSTDILSFNYSEDISILDGEIIISLDDARNNSKKFKVPFNQEIARLVIHGVLHLIGFDDNNRLNKIKMKRMENKLLNRFKFILLRSR